MFHVQIQYFDFCVQYSVLTTKNLVFIRPQIADPLTHFALPYSPFHSENHYAVSIFTCLFLFGLVCSFIFFNIAHMNEVIFLHTLKFSQSLLVSKSQ